jgi:macrolide transport system ATP-binding/permease protein
MRRLRAWAWRVAGTLRPGRRDREFLEELESHLQLHADDNVRAGLSPEEARRQAVLKLGGLEATRALRRDRAGLPAVAELQQDLHYGLRALRRNPGYTATAAVTLALGIGATTAIFTLLDAVLLRDLPVPAPERLIACTAARRTPTSRTPIWIACGNGPPP